MRPDPTKANPLRPSPDPDLTSHALGRLAPAERERVERALRTDADLRARHAIVAAHLARYDALDAPPPPPFATLAMRLDGSRQVEPRGPRLLLAASAAAAILLATIGLAFLFSDGTSPPSFRPGEGLHATAGGTWTAADEPAEGWIGEHVHVVMDRDARLEIGTERRVRLLAGRAEFEVEPGSGAFAVATAHGDVRVLGTRFEVDVTDAALYVAVAAGRVEVAGHQLVPGQALVDDRVDATPREVGAFYRRPDLRLGVLGSPRVGEPVTLTFTFSNPGRVPFALAGPDGVRAALWLEVVDPHGQVHDVAVPGVDAAGGPLAPGLELWLPGRGETSFTARLGRPLWGDRGTYRCRALYRPGGQPSRVSDALLLEVR